MSADRTPAREWYDLVVATAAVKGWSIADVFSRSGVARSTVYGWRDNRGKPQAKSVNAVADALGIPRERALRAAGIIGERASPESERLIPPKLLEAIQNDPELTDEQRRSVISAIESQLAKERAGGAVSSAARGEAERRQRPASLSSACIRPASRIAGCPAGSVRTVPSRRWHRRKR